jgi:hypothetical protein
MSQGEDARDREARIRNGVRVVREGHGANCSSIGSVIDAIFASAVLGGAVFAAVVASLGKEQARVVGAGTVPRESEPPAKDDEAAP